MLCNYRTKYGKITLYKNDIYIKGYFDTGKYWDEDTLLRLKKYINPNKNILEIGGHCGTSSIVYASFLSDKNKVYVFEPQKHMYNLLCKNIKDNNLEHKIIPFNKGVFCYNGTASMHNIDLDGRGKMVENCITSEEYCNFGGITLGTDGEDINTVTIDDMEIDDIGYIHCDAQGSENFIFSESIKTLEKFRPVILYENNAQYGKYLFDNVCEHYKQYIKESEFDVKNYCMNVLNYVEYIDQFNDSIDTLLIPDHGPIDLGDYEKQYFSQNGEDGITNKLIDLLYGKLKYKDKYCVEFGSGNGTECNTRYCREHFGWDGLMMDMQHENADLNLHQEYIHKDNIVSLFKKYKVPTHFNLLSVDIDFNDFYCLREILKEYDIDIVICEYNATHLPTEDKIIIYEQDGCWDGTNYFGGSLLAFNKLCEDYGYKLVYCDNKGVNCFFVKTYLLEQNNINILNGGDVIKLYKSPKYGYGPRGGHTQDTKNRKYVNYNDAIKLV